MSWTVTLDGLPWLNANRRLHHQQHARRVREIRAEAAIVSLSARIPKLRAAFVLGYVHPTSKRRFDPANWYPSFKAVVDGALVDAGVVPDDDHVHVSGPHMLPAHPVPASSGGRLTLVVFEAARCRCGHDSMEHVGAARCVRPLCGCLRYREPAVEPVPV